MRNLVLVKKYADGLARAIADEAEYGVVGGEVRAFRDLLVSREDLHHALTSPFINARRRAAVLDALLPGLQTSPKTTRFLKLLLDHKRLGILPEIADALPGAWADRQGIITYEVASAVPLAAVQQARLSRTLEAAEGRPVRLILKSDPGLLGGLALRKGHIVYDASVEGELRALQERLGKA